jgi:glycosyltransferase involved in cell wall biosynthesis
MNGDRIRVLAIIEASTVTGPAKNLIRFCRYTRADRGMSRPEMSIATFHRGEQDTVPPNQFIEAVHQSGTELIVIPERGRFDRRVVADLSRAVEATRPNVIQTHGVKSHFLARLSGIVKQRPWVAFHHGYTAEDLKMQVYNQLNRWSLRAADLVITVCQPFAEELVRTGIRRNTIRVLPNSIEVRRGSSEQDIAGVRERLKIGAGERVVLSVGRFSREKAQADLIRAVAETAQRHPDLRFRLVLVGEGPEQVSLEALVTTLGLSEKVVFTGHQMDVMPYYGVADVFALPSLSEGSPNVLLEAMAAGVPIVATEVGGVPETVRHEHSALLVPKASPSKLAIALARVLTDSDLADQLRRQAQAQVTRYSPETYADSLTELYRIALSTFAARPPRPAR